jgi:hypothetical protein
MYDSVHTLIYMRSAFPLLLEFTFDHRRCTFFLLIILSLSQLNEGH